jgi:RNA polymerase sigma-70 factor (ECF subfamily)
VATVVLGGANGADDVVQDASVLAWRFRASFVVDREFRPWYLRIVANAAKNARRAWGRRARLELRLAAMAGSQDDDQPESAAVSDAERRLVVTALNRLRRDDRLVIALRFFEQMSEAEMAEVLACPAGTVKSRLARAMVRLRQQLPAPTGEVDR